MRITLASAPWLNQIYFSVDDDHVRVIKRGWEWLDWLPTWINSPSRYCIYGGETDNPKYWLGGFRKPNPGMLRLAIAKWFDQYELHDQLHELLTTYFVRWEYPKPSSFSAGLIPLLSLALHRSSPPTSKLIFGLTHPQYPEPPAPCGYYYSIVLYLADIYLDCMQLVSGRNHC